MLDTSVDRYACCSVSFFNFLVLCFLSVSYFVIPLSTHMTSFEFLRPSMKAEERSGFKFAAEPKIQQEQRRKTAARKIPENHRMKSKHDNGAEFDWPVYQIPILLAAEISR